MFETLGPVAYLAQCCNLYKLAKNSNMLRLQRDFADFFGGTTTYWTTNSSLYQAIIKDNFMFGTRCL